MDRVILRLRFVDIPRTAPVCTGQVNTMPTAEIVHPDVLSIEEYLRRRLKPVEGVIPHLAGIDMHGNSIPTDSVGGDVFESLLSGYKLNRISWLETSSKSEWAL